MLSNIYNAILMVTAGFSFDMFDQTFDLPIYILVLNLWGSTSMTRSAVTRRLTFSPLLWLLVLNKIVMMLPTTAYADDVVLLTFEIDLNPLSNIITTALEVVSYWALSNDLKVIPPYKSPWS